MKTIMEQTVKLQEYNNNKGGKLTKTLTDGINTKKIELKTKDPVQFENLKNNFINQNQKAITKKK